MLLGIAALQGFALSFILYFNPRGTQLSNKILAALLFFFSLILTEESLESLGYHHTIARITGFTFLTELFLAPLTLLFALVITRIDYKLTKRQLIHLLFPVLLNTVYIPYHILVDWNAHLINQPSLSGVFTAIIAAKILYQLTYQILSIRKVHAFIKASDGKNKGNARYSLAKWLRNVLSSVIVLIPLVMIFEILQDQIAFDPDYITSIIMLVAIYSIGYAALRNPIVYARHGEEINIEGQSAGSKYRTSPLTTDTKKEHAERLLKFVDTEKPYLDPDLTFAQLAHKLNLSSHHLSQVLNEVLNQNFYDFINSYRVREVISKIEQNGLARANILSLGLQSGFNSKATLNRAFKKNTGVSPQHYLRMKNSDLKSFN